MISLYAGCRGQIAYLLSDEKLRVVIIENALDIIRALTLVEVGFIKGTNFGFTWVQVEKRIADLIRMDSYLNPKEMEKYPEWLAEQEQHRAEMAEREKTREILRNAPPEIKEPEV